MVDLELLYSAFKGNYERLRGSLAASFDNLPITQAVMDTALAMQRTMAETSD